MAAAQHAQGAGANTYVLGAPTEDINEHYVFGKKLGQPGMFGQAILAQKKKPEPDGSQLSVAVKIIDKTRFNRNALDTRENYAAFRYATHWRTRAPGQH